MKKLLYICIFALICTYSINLYADTEQQQIAQLKETISKNTLICKVSIQEKGSKEEPIHSLGAIIYLTNMKKPSMIIANFLVDGQKGSTGYMFNTKNGLYTNKSKDGSEKFIFNIKTKTLTDIDVTHNITYLLKFNNCQIKYDLLELAEAINNLQ